MMKVSIIRNHSVDLRSKSMDRFLYDRDLHHERVKPKILKIILQYFKKCYNGAIEAFTKFSGKAWIYFSLYRGLRIREQWSLKNYFLNIWVEKVQQLQNQVKNKTD